MSRNSSSRRQKKLVSLLIQARRDASMSQVDLAKLLHKPQSFVSKIETGERRLEVLEFLNITSKIGCNASIIIEILLKTEE